MSTPVARRRVRAINRLWRGLCRREYRRFQRDLAHPEPVQRRLLASLIGRNRHSRFGRAHGLERIDSLEAFRRKVPIRGYDQLRPWIDEARASRDLVITGSPVRRFITTSGSTSGAKSIPYTGPFEREFQRAIQAWIGDLYTTMPELMDGASYWSITPPATIDPTAASEQDDSRYLGGTLGRLVARTLAVDARTAGLPDLPDFEYATLLQLLRRDDLRVVSVWHPSVLLGLFRRLRELWEPLLADLATGESQVARAWLRAAPMPDRAAALRATDPRRVDLIWPALRLLSCWGDAHARAPAAELQQLLPHTVVQPKGLLATEGIVTIPQMESAPGGHPLAIRSHVYEFADEADEIHAPWELEAGRHYDVIITADNGLWRYRLGDRVEVTGFLARTPCLRFIGRGDTVSDQCGEKLEEPFVRTRLDEVFQRYRIDPTLAFLAPEQTPTGARYRLIIQSDTSELEGIARNLDEQLRDNPHYALCQDLGQLGPLAELRVGVDAQRMYMDIQRANGIAYGDIKPIALSPSTGWTERFSN